MCFAILNLFQGGRMPRQQPPLTVMVTFVLLLLLTVPLVAEPPEDDAFPVVPV